LRKGKKMATKLTVNRLRVVVLSWIVTSLAVPAALGSVIDVTVTTEKTSYSLNEPIHIFVTAANPGDSPIVLTFGTSYQAGYLIDGLYDWSQGMFFSDSFTSVTIPVHGSHTWDLDSRLWPLAAGTHSIVGSVIGYADCPTASFEVTPEPASMLLLTVGGAALLRRRR